MSGRFGTMFASNSTKARRMRRPTRKLVEVDEMNVIALVLVTCLPHSSDCKQVIQHPAPATHEECNQRAAALQKTLAGSIDDAGYRPLQVICMYGDTEE
jgi:hypothetical protein